MPTTCGCIDRLATLGLGPFPVNGVHEILSPGIFSSHLWYRWFVELMTEVSAIGSNDILIVVVTDVVSLQRKAC